ncbi:MAG: S8/S53 family peptidase [Bacteroidota bacterium]
MNNNYKCLLSCLLGLTLLFQFNLKAQTYEPNYKDGIVWFKFNGGVENNITVGEDNVVDINQIPFLINLIDTYKITSIKRPFNINNDPNLLLTYQIEFSEYSKINDLMNELKNNKDIEYVEKIVRRKAFWTPNDPYYTSNASSINWGWHLDKIQADLAWNIQQNGSSAIKVAVVDNAIWTSHPDLTIATANQYNASTGAAGNPSPPTTISQTGSYPSNLDPYLWSHGTHVSGLVGANSNNGIGVASIGHGVTLMAIRSADNNGNMWSTALMGGVQWATNNGAKVINMSWGGYTSSTTEQNVITAAHNAGVTLVAAAGNNGDGGEDATNINGILYPANYTYVISVAATNNDDKLATFSEYGSWIDVASPGGYINETYGVSVLSTTYCNNMVTSYVGYINITGYYDVMQGTSMASPIVAGLCGLMLSKNPNLTPTQIENCLKGINSDALASGSNAISSGNGRINAYKALLCVQALAVKEESENSLPVYIYPNPTVDIVTVNFNNTDVHKVSVEVYNPLGQQIQPMINNIDNSQLSIDLTGQMNGIYYLHLNTDKGNAIKKLMLLK